jgi:hypothetical protein
MIQIKKKHLLLALILNIGIIVIVAFAVNYTYSKLFWSNRVSVHSGISSPEFLGNDSISDTITKAYIGQAYKIGTAFEVYKPKDPLLKVVSENHGAIELAVASGTNHFSDLAERRDAVIRKVGEGNLIFSIPSFGGDNRAIIFGNEKKKFMEITNMDELLIYTKNISLDCDGNLTLYDLYFVHQGDKISLTQYLHELHNRLNTAIAKIDSLGYSLQ